MNIQIDGPKDNQRGVRIDDSPHPDFYIAEKELQELLKEARKGLWSDNAENGIRLGKQLFNLLNRNSGQLQQEIEECTNYKREFNLYLSLPKDLTEIPFELLYNHDFIFLKTNSHVIRMVGNSKAELPTVDRPLKLIFVAASPTDLEHATLSFEQEEEIILDATKKYPIDFQTEDTGSLEGIKELLYEIDGTDVLHITGHAGIDMEKGPIFCMEDEQGNLHNTTPKELYESIKDFKPKLVFLSGCSTGKSDKNIGVESFSYQLVEKGIPYVLSWGLPVGDVGASKFVASLYEKLTMGKSIYYAVNEARRSARVDYHPWPLMRLFTDGTKSAGLVKTGQRAIRKSSRKTIHKNLQDSNVQILKEGFVGRRRQLQQGLGVLKNRDTYEGKYGVFIHGPAGVGKSCLAGRLLERQTGYDLIVFRGELRSNNVIHGLKDYFDRKGDEKALEILESDRTYKGKIKELYRSIFSEKKILVYFDDFEQNLELQKHTWYLKSPFINNFKPFLQYIDYAENQSKIVITSCYLFDLQVDEENLVDKFLHYISLASFTGADEDKKIKQLPSVSKSRNLELYRKSGHGYPRLMDWLETIARDEEKYDIVSLKKEIEGNEEEYIREYLTEIISKNEGDEFTNFLNKSSVYRIRVEASAYESIGIGELLERGVDSALFEKETIQNQEARYWVMPVIRKLRWNLLSNEEKRTAHKKALNWYDKFLESKKIIAYHHEAVHHALEANEIDLAAKHVIPFGKELCHLLYFYDAKEIYEQVITKITDEVINEAKTNNNQSISFLINEYANLLLNVGEYHEALKYFNQSIQIDLEVYGDKHHKVASGYNNKGEAYRKLYNPQKALKGFNLALQIDLKVYGDKHPIIALRYNNIGCAYIDLRLPQEALHFLNKALQIDIEVYGNKHQNVAIDYNNIGSAYHELGEISEAIKYFNRALQIDLRVYGDIHPNVAIRYNNLGGVYQYFGKVQKAVEYFNKAVEYFNLALQIDLEVYGTKHPNIAIRYYNLGDTYRYLGNTLKAVEYFTLALEIYLEVYGDKHPKVATIYKSLIDIFRSERKQKEELEYLQQFLPICEEVYGIDHETTIYIKKRIQELENR